MLWRRTVTFSIKPFGGLLGTFLSAVAGDFSDSTVSTESSSDVNFDKALKE